MYFTEAIDHALAQAMVADPRIILLGEDVRLLRRNLLVRFGPRRVLDTPISEGAFLGAGVAAAMAGLRPVVEMYMKETIAAFRAPDRNLYPELDGYTRDELYEDYSGGGGAYLAIRIARTMRLRAGDIVLDLGCGKGAASLLLAKHFGVKLIAVDLWTSATFLNQKFTERGYRDQIVPLHLDVTDELPFAEGYFDAVFCMNSLNFYGDNVDFLRHLLKHVKPDGQLCIGSEVLTDEFSEEQLKNPPEVYSFNLPPPNEHVNVFEDDFKRQHSPRWWRELFENSGLLEVESCETVEDAAVLYQEMVRHEYEHDLDPFDVKICLAQMEWERTHSPQRSLFVLAAHKV